jgi:hypothetical protein
VPDLTTAHTFLEPVLERLTEPLLTSLPVEGGSLAGEVAQVDFEILAPKCISGADWYNTGWLYRKPIILNHTKVPQRKQTSRCW